MPPHGWREDKLCASSRPSCSACPPRRHATREGRDEDAARLLTDAVECCATGEELLALAVSTASDQDFIHVSAFLVKLTRIRPVQNWKRDRRVRQLVARAGAALAHMEPWQLSNVLWACAKLGISPPWLRDWVALTCGKLRDFAGQELSLSLFALALLEFDAGSAWLSDFYRASLRLFRDATANSEFPQVVCLIINASAMLSYVCNARPSTQWLDAFWAYTTESLPAFEAKQLSVTFWGLSLLRITPPAMWLPILWTSSLPKLHFMSQQSLSLMILGAQRLGLTPPPDWLLCFEAESRSILPTFDLQALANTTYAYAKLGVRPNDAWLNAFVDTALAGLSSFHAPCGRGIMYMMLYGVYAWLGFGPVDQRTSLANEAGVRNALVSMRRKLRLDAAKVEAERARALMRQTAGAPAEASSVVRPGSYAQAARPCPPPPRVAQPLQPIAEHSACKPSPVDRPATACCDGDAPSPLAPSAALNRSTASCCDVAAPPSFGSAFIPKPQVVQQRAVPPQTAQQQQWREEEERAAGQACFFIWYPNTPMVFAQAWQQQLTAGGFAWVSGGPMLLQRCRFFGTVPGCRYGDACRFVHMRVGFTRPNRSATANGGSLGGLQGHGTCMSRRYRPPLQIHDTHRFANCESGTSIRNLK